MLCLLLEFCSFRLVASLRSSWTLDLLAALIRLAFVLACEGAVVAMLALLDALEGLLMLEGRLSSPWWCPPTS